MKTVVIIGAGVVGSAVARHLALDGQFEVLVFERNGSVAGENQSSRNSGVVHAGIYYEHTSAPLKARLCVEGNALLYDYCARYRVPCRRCGKLVVAADECEQEYLERTLAIARENGVPGIEMISPERVQQLEPAVNAAGGALYVPSSGIVEPTRLVETLAMQAQQAGALFITDSRVTALQEQNNMLSVTVQSHSNKEIVDCDIVINAAGLFADEVARMLNPDAGYRIKPVRGESAKFYRNIHEGVQLNGMNVYPAPYGYYNSTGERAAVPYAEFVQLRDAGEVTGTVGIHLTPTFGMDGNDEISSTVTVGPAKTVGVGKENYGSNLRPPDYYTKHISRFYPGIHPEDCSLYQTGIMAVRPDGPDWLIEPDIRYGQMINMIGIDSPGLTACLSLAEYVADMADRI